MGSKSTFWTQLLFKVTELFIGLGITYGVFRLNGGSGPFYKDLTSMLVGLVAALFLAAFQEGFLTREEIKDAKAEIIGAVNALRANNEELRGLIGGKIGGNEKLTVLLDYAEREVSREETPELWCKLCWVLQDSFAGTNYTHLGEIYDQPWAEQALAVQYAKIKAKKPVRKIMLVDDATEVTGPIADRTLKPQALNGIQIRWCLRKRAEEYAMTRGIVSRLRTIEFSIIDDFSVLEWDVELADPRSYRTVKGSRLVFKRETVRVYQQCFDLLWDMAAPYTV